MKGNNGIIVIVGGIIFGIFIAISLINIPFANKESAYYSVNLIKGINYNNGKLSMELVTENSAVCVKNTKTTPSSDALCWVSTDNGKVNISIYEGKTYFIWVKEDKLITYYGRYNTMKD